MSRSNVEEIFQRIFPNPANLNAFYETVHEIMTKKEYPPVDVWLGCGGSNGKAFCVKVVELVYGSQFRLLGTAHVANADLTYEHPTIIQELDAEKKYALGNFRSKCILIANTKAVINNTVINDNKAMRLITFESTFVRGPSSGEPNVYLIDPTIESRSADIAQVLKEIVREKYGANNQPMPRGNVDEIRRRISSNVNPNAFYDIHLEE